METRDKIFKALDDVMDFKENAPMELARYAPAIRDLLKEKEGMVLVPVEPTEEIIKAIKWQIGPEEKTAGTAKGIYKAMLIASTKEKI